MAGSSSRRSSSDGTVEITLANPLTPDEAVKVRLPAEEHPVGSKVKVARDDALRLVTAGYAAGIDPEDQQGVAKALNLPEPPATASTQPV